MFALKIDHPKNDDEFNLFIETLKNNINSIPDGTRIQLTVQSGEHWFPLDLEIAHGNVSAIIPEAGFSPTTANATFRIMNSFPNAAIYRFYPDEVSVDGKMRTLMIQSDGESCSRFALQQLFALQHSPDIHQKMHDIQGRLPTVELAPNTSTPYRHYGLSFNNSPPEIAGIFRSTQSLSALNALDKTVKESIINSKGETLEQYKERFTRANPNANDRLQNMAIMDFKEKYANKTISYLNKTKKEDLEHSLDLATRGGIDFINKGDSYRETYIQKQKEKANDSKIQQKTIRNNVWQQVNTLCREKLNALSPFSNDPEVKALIDNIRTIRVNFMGAKQEKKESLKSIYNQQLIEMNLATSNVINFLKAKDEHNYSNVINKINSLSSDLNATINPIERSNMLSSNFSMYKEKLISLREKSKTESEINENNTNLVL
ncbi:Dot/Icm T4SS effector [Legionella gratiana]|uniref:Dot/Icm T4SS effector n=1 Tax=Legionella gratiana TaxID=45066 RepID=A0A378JDL1_9GAMM|nr:hypothetical protein [Legionella gratiana]KTD15622.1 Dot/Icm T4SS effector [Legionella gratiana]STX44957.1 Dot/Icm T4SS effector [Legionella gratiana]